MDADCRKERLQIFRRHVLRVHLDFHGGSVPCSLISASEVCGRGANFQDRRLHYPRAFAEIVFGSEIDGDRNAGRRTSRNEKCLGKLHVAFGFRLAAARGQRAVQIDNAAETRRGVQKTRRGKIQRANRQLCF